jgi:tetrapyrrole methylase family protein/MazG family protein
MELFDALVRVAEELLGPNGCPWDKKQTFQSLQPYVLEEAHEVIEAVDLGDDPKIVEELGDLLYTVLFYGKLAEKTGRFSLEQIISAIKEKLIRRHPHIFGDVKVKDVDEIIANWEKIKKQEKVEKSPLEEIPPTLPSLLKGQKLLKKLRKMGFDPLGDKQEEKLSEEDIGKRLLLLLSQANYSEIDAESALRRAMFRLADRFEEWKSLQQN